MPQLKEYMDQLLGGNPPEHGAPYAFNPINACRIFDDFMEYVTTDRWTSVIASTGTAAASDAHGGVLVLTTAATDNDSVVVRSTNELILPVNGKKLFFQARIKYTEIGTDDANVFVGLSDTVDATILGDDGAGSPASYDGIGFHKVDGGTTWIVECSNAATQTTKAATETAPTRQSGSWQHLAFSLDFNAAGTAALVDFFVDGICVAHEVSLTLSGLAEMHVVVAVQAGAAAIETLYVDYIDVAFDR
jgi:hypothetical protein